MELLKTVGLILCGLGAIALVIPIIICEWKLSKLPKSD
jgi:hypothetical protein